MGMYTHCRGWISLRDLNITKQQFNKIIEKAENISERASQCIACTIFNRGFDWCNYIFIGGQIKSYDNDWNIFLNFLFKNFVIDDYNIQTKYEEDNKWTNYKNDVSVVNPEQETKNE